MARDFADLGRVRRFIASLPADVVVLSGGARGVDRSAADAARARGLDCLEYFADWDRDGRYLVSTAFLLEPAAENVRTRLTKLICLLSR